MEPKFKEGQFVAGGINEDTGEFVMVLPEDEMVARGLLSFLSDELDRHYYGKRVQKVMDQAAIDKIAREMNRKRL